MTCVPFPFPFPGAGDCRGARGCRRGVVADLRADEDQYRVKAERAKSRERKLEYQHKAAAVHDAALRWERAGRYGRDV